MRSDNTKAILGILERLPVPALIANPVTAEILWVNSRIVKMSEARRAEDIVGRSLFDFIQAPQIAKALADLAKVALKISPPAVTYQLRRASGEPAAAQVASVPMLFGGQLAMLSIVTDVSDREKLLNDLSESEERYRLLVDASPEGIWVVADEVVVYANAVLADVLGFGDPAGLIGKHVLDVIDPTDVGTFKSVRRQVLMTGETMRAAQVRLKCASGDPIQATAHVARARWEGGFATQTLFSELDFLGCRGSSADEGVG